MSLSSILTSISDFLWGAPLLILLVGTGIYLTFRLKLLQITKLPLALKYVFGKDDEEDDDDAKGDVSKIFRRCSCNKI